MWKICTQITSITPFNNAQLSIAEVIDCLITERISQQKLIDKRKRGRARERIKL